ncbi:hypothetical protein PB2503_04092 [Parvularcula bermudensis HTCC2503]|uniref:Nudix hydrolase domain-containing protein n=1 Tax=Parvularcula bermudensis (strain ATCC BAA-594 / HTCC2503 / KCTC 12087) TaxID=314260 RepID=E0TEL0_PARBH|nr:NUDIX hydrolase [Parvularcula bermudensis]ADM08893.1 hypothetical protein PB2503_04092 [Parvularcula bermudensis HTCC2503]
MVTSEDMTPSFSRKIPDGDDRERSVCRHCGFIDYQNPRIVVGSVVVAGDGRLLLCKRAIEPRKGFWTLPAGYLETGEAPEEGAMREAREEANAELKIDRLLAIYSIPRISQVQLLYRAELLNKDKISPGPESADLKLVPWRDIPWPELAFPSVVWALNAWNESKEEAAFAPYTNPQGGL